MFIDFKGDKGIFIDIEGGEGAGKTFQIEKLRLQLEKEGITCVKTREPGGGKVSERIRDIILTEDIDPYTEAYLFASARREHVVNLIKPSLKEGKFVLCDRFVHSSIVYQGYARNLGMDYIRELNDKAVDGCYPDIVFYLDIEPEVGLSRIKNNNRETNRLDNEAMEFHKKVREGFLKLAEEDNTFIVINANQSPDEVFNDIWTNLKKLIK